jgi:hypothetical protein
MWHYCQRGVKALAAMGRKAEAIRYAEASRGLNDNSPTRPCQPGERWPALRPVDEPPVAVLRGERERGRPAPVVTDDEEARLSEHVAHQAPDVVGERLPVIAAVCSGRWRR